jgi:hypothetical protein
MISLSEAEVETWRFVRRRFPYPRSGIFTKEKLFANIMVIEDIELPAFTNFILLVTGYTFSQQPSKKNICTRG